jgi:hypothetical protein
LSQVTLAVPIFHSYGHATDIEWLAW